MSGYSALAGVYDLFNGDVDYGAVADFLAAQLAQHKGLLLDLGCGTGSLSVAMSQRGFEVVGVDASEGMLMHASRKALEAEQDILFVRQAFDELDLYGSFSACVCTFDTLNHLARAEDLALLLRRLRHFLDPGALFVFDVNSLYKHRTLLGDTAFVDSDDDYTLVWQCHLRQDDTVEWDITVFSPAGQGLYRRETEQFAEIYLSDAVIREALAQAGYALMRGPLDGFSDRDAHDTSERWLYIAQRQ